MDTDARAEKCGQPAASFIPRWGMSFACCLPKGHEGEHKRGGTCFKHGEYIGEQCSKWPDCIQNTAPTVKEPTNDRALEVAREFLQMRPMHYCDEVDCPKCLPVLAALIKKAIDKETAVLQELLYQWTK